MTSIKINLRSYLLYKHNNGKAILKQEFGHRCGMIYEQKNAHIRKSHD